MNWTGGRLQRHSGNAKTSLTSLQKQHFAKLHNSLGYGKRKRSPILRLAVNLVNNRRDFAPDNPKEWNVEHGTYRHGQECRSILESMQNKSAQPLSLCSNQRSLSPDPKDAEPEAQEVTERRGMSITPELVAAVPGIEETVIEKKRRLLNKQDWVGINLQKPLQMQFLLSRSSGDIGRRRKIADGHKARYNGKRQAISSPVHKCKDHRRPHVQNRESSMAPPASNEVRILIGGRVGPGASSSSMPSRATLEQASQRSLIRRSITSSSDVMLLDKNEALFGCQTSLLHAGPIRGFGSSSQGVHRGTAITDITSMPSKYSVRDTAGFKYPELGFEDRGHRLDASDLIESPKLRGLRSSSLPLHQPVPQRLSQLISSTSYEDDFSIIAQLSPPKTQITSSQNAYDNLWKTWMAFSRSTQCQSSSCGNDRHCAHNPSMAHSLDNDDESRVKLVSGSGISSTQDVLQFSHHNTKASHVERLHGRMSRPWNALPRCPSLSRPSPEMIARPNTKAIRLNEDAEATWKEFVFGNDDGDLNRADDGGRTWGMHGFGKIHAYVDGPDHVQRQGSLSAHDVSIPSIETQQISSFDQSNAVVRKPTIESNSSTPSGWTSSLHSLAEFQLSTLAASARGIAQQGTQSSNSRRNVDIPTASTAGAVSTTVSENANFRAHVGNRVVFSRPRRFQGSSFGLHELPSHIAPNIGGRRLRNPQHQDPAATILPETDLESIEDD